jgi:hypothetical protein
MIFLSFNGFYNHGTISEAPHSVNDLRWLAAANFDQTAGGAIQRVRGQRIDPVPKPGATDSLHLRARSSCSIDGQGLLRWT